MIKGIIHQEDITNVNTHAPNIGTSTSTRETQLDIKVQITPIQ